MQKVPGRAGEFPKTFNWMGTLVGHEKFFLLLKNLIN
jgi:hypothetical protein